MNHDAKHFLLKLLPFLLGIIVIDLLLGAVGTRLVAHLPGNYNKLSQHNYRMNLCTADVVLIGASRCQQHYRPDLLRDSIAAYRGDTLTVYNAGIDGTGLCPNLCAIETMLSHHTPKMLILDVGDADFCSYQASTLRYLLPFYSHTPQVKQYIDAIGPKQRLLARSNLCRYNGRHLIEMVSAYRHPRPGDGYYPNPQTMDTSLLKPTPTTPHTLSDTNALLMSAFRRVVHLCREQGVSLIISISPRYRPQAPMALTAEICRMYHLPLIDMYSVDTLNRHPELFRDLPHLNYKGAPIFTSLYFSQLKPYLDSLPLP